MDGLGIHLIAHINQSLGSGRQQGLIFRRERAGCWNLAVAILGDHGQNPLSQIAQIIRQIGIDAVDHAFLGKRPIIAIGHFAHQEIAHLIQPEFTNNRLGRDDIAQGFGHLLAFDIQKTVPKHPLGQRQVCGHQEGRPVNRVEPHDILADDMNIGGPEFHIGFRGFIGKTGRGDIIGQRVQPDIHDMLVIARHRNAPIETGARNGQIRQPLFHEIHHFVAAIMRQDEIRICFIMRQQLVAIG